MVSQAPKRFKIFQKEGKSIHALNSENMVYILIVICYEPNDIFSPDVFLVQSLVCPSMYLSHYFVIDIYHGKNPNL